MVSSLWMQTNLIYSFILTIFKKLVSQSKNLRHTNKIKDTCRLSLRSKLWNISVNTDNHEKLFNYKLWKHLEQKVKERT